MAVRPLRGERRTRGLGLVVGALAFAGVLVGCGGSNDESGATSGQLRKVPEDYPSIQAAVDASDAGDLVLVAPGRYPEAVTVEQSDITIRGADRNTVVLDGSNELANGFAVRADGVSVENLTVHSYTQNGIIFTGEIGQGSYSGEATSAALDGYAARYVTAYNNGLYGVYAFASTNGTIDHVYVSGHPDSGIYVGQCKPCDVVINESVADSNAIGYFGTNASGGVYVVRSEFTNNRLGVTPNSQDMELLSPQVETFIVGNVVSDNDNPAAPAIPQGFFGGGIAVGGGTSDIVRRNLVTGHDGYGIGVVPLNQFEPARNEVTENVLRDNALDLLYENKGEQVWNCFADNVFASSQPIDIESVMPCPGENSATKAVRWTPLVAPDQVDYRSITPPGDQLNMPGDLAALPRGPAGAPEVPDLDAIEVPNR